MISPNDVDRAWVHERYVSELLLGEFRNDTRLEFIALIERLCRDEGVDGVILGGTELCLLLSAPVIAGIPALDTTALHVEAIVARLHSLPAAESRTSS